jgi:hypothetical protein
LCVHELTDELMAVVVLAADHAMDCVRHGALSPFVLSETPLGARRLQRVLAPSSAGAAEQLLRARLVAQECARHDGIAALAYATRMPVDRAEADAVYVEACQHDGPVLVFAQRYRPRRRLRSSRPVGRLAFLGEVVRARAA